MKSLIKIFESLVKGNAIKTDNYVNPIEHSCKIDLTKTPNWHNLTVMQNWINDTCGDEIEKALGKHNIHDIKMRCDSEHYYIVSTKKTRVTYLSILCRNNIIAGSTQCLIRNPNSIESILTSIIAKALHMEHNENEPAEWLAPGAKSIVKNNWLVRK